MTGYYRERAEGSDATLLVVEHATWLYLLQDKFATSASSSAEVAKTIAIAREIETDFKALHFASLLQARMAGDDLISHSRSIGLWLRNPGFRREEREELARLFTPLQDHLENKAGFSILQALDLEDALFSHLTKSIRPKLGLFDIDPQSYVVTADLLSRESGCPRTISKNFLDFFSLSPGQKHPGSDLLPTRIELLERQPIVRLPDDQYLCHLSSKLIWAIRPSLEGTFDTNWHSYDTHRASYLEHEVETILTGLGGECWKGLHYRMRDSASIQHELDALWHLQGVSILAECKAGKYTLASLRGAPKGVKSDVKELITKADEQLRRAEEQLLSIESGGFDSPNGVIQPPTTYAFRIAVTLDATPFATEEETLVKEQLLQQLGRTWVVSLHDLRCIVHVLRLPSLFIDYLRRRTKIQLARIKTSDELDLLGHYLSDQLQFQTGFDAIGLGSFTEEIDRYFEMPHPSNGDFAPWPQFSPSIIELVRTLERLKCTDHLEGALFLLEGASEFEGRFQKNDFTKRERGLSGLVVHIETSEQILIFQRCDGRVRLEDLKKVVDETLLTSNKRVMGIARSTISVDGICVYMPREKST